MVSSSSFCIVLQTVAFIFRVDPWMLIADTSRAEAGSSKPCLEYRFFVGKNVTQSMVHQVRYFQNGTSLLDQLNSIFPTTVKFVQKELNIKIEWEAIKKHNLFPNAKLKYANMKMRGLCFFPLYNWLNCHCWRLHGFLFPLQPYSIGQTEKYIATDETHHLGTLCFQLPAEVLSKTLQLPLWKKKSIRCNHSWQTVWSLKSFPSWRFQ